MKPIHIVLTVILAMTAAAIFSPACAAQLGIQSQTQKAVQSEKESGKSTTLPSSPKNRISQPASKLPDLAVKAVTLDDCCRILIQLTNGGPGDITPMQFQRSRIELRYGGRIKRLALPRTIQRHGATATVNTKIRLCPPEGITATIIFPYDEHDNQKRNNGRTVRMVAPAKPCKTCNATEYSDVRRCSPKQPATARTLAKPKPEMRVRGTAGVSKPSSSMTSVKRILGQRSGGSTDGMTHSVSSGMRISGPAGSGEVTQRSFRVRYEVSNRVPDGDITFGVTSGGETIVETTLAWHYDGAETSATVWVSRSLLINLPYDAPNGEYTAWAVSGASFAVSDPFEVNVVDGIGMSVNSGVVVDINFPARPYWFHYGDRVDLWIHTPGLSSTMGDIHARLISEADSSRYFEVPVHELGGGVTGFMLSYTFPASIAEGYYRFYAESGEPGCGTAACYGLSERVYIGPEPPEAERSVRIDAPLGGETYRTGSGGSLTARWYATAETNHYAEYILYKGGVEMLRGTKHHSHGNTAMLSVFGFLSGGDYQLQVNIYENDDVDGEDVAVLRASETTDYFSIINDNDMDNADNHIIVRLPNGGSYAVGSPLELYWTHWPTHTAGRSVRLSLVRDSHEGGGEWLINASAPPPSDAITWTIPADVPPGDGYRLRIEELSPGSEVDVSYIPFTVVP